MEVPASSIFNVRFVEVIQSSTSSEVLRRLLVKAVGIESRTKKKSTALAHSSQKSKIDKADTHGGSICSVRVETPTIARRPSIYSSHFSKRP